MHWAGRSSSTRKIFSCVILCRAACATPRSAAEVDASCYNSIGPAPVHVPTHWVIKKQVWQKVPGDVANRLAATPPHPTVFCALVSIFDVFYVHYAFASSLAVLALWQCSLYGGACSVAMLTNLLRVSMQSR